MFKLVVLSALVAIAAARPGYLHSSPHLYSSGHYGSPYSSLSLAPSISLHEPLYGHSYGHSLGHSLDLGHSYGHSYGHHSLGHSHAYVPAISHQSSTIVHDTPIIKSYHAAPIISSAPLYSSHGYGLGGYGSSYGGWNGW